MLSIGKEGYAPPMTVAELMVILSNYPSGSCVLFSSDEPGVYSVTEVRSEVKRHNDTGNHWTSARKVNNKTVFDCVVIG